MKVSNFLMIGVFMLFLFTSCKDNTKKESMKNAMDVESPEMDQTMEGDNAQNQNTDTSGGDSAETNSVADVIRSSEEHNTLMDAMTAAGIIVKLDGTKDYTVFAPTDAAFDDLRSGTIEDLMKPENSDKLEGILSYHIIPGIVDGAKLTDLIKSSDNGEYTLVTANNGKLTATINAAGNIILTDNTGDEATVVGADMTASNGVVHSINSVLMRK